MTIEHLNQQVEAQRGKPGGWPEDLTYRATNETNVAKVIVSDADTARKGVWKKIDPWGFAFFKQVRDITGKPVEMKFSLRLPDSPTDAFQYEALKRRLSYLAVANNLTITLEKGGSPDPIYAMTELNNRPSDEKVRDDFGKRGDDDAAGRLEKDFQTYLFGKGLHDDPEQKNDRTNERLALFGPDFIRIGKKGCRYKVEREFPTGAFHKTVKESNRLLSTEYVDLVTINRKGELALVELKFDDPKLEVIPQVLNYALFFYSYRNQLTPLLDKRLDCSTSGRNLVTYLVSNTFHERFETVFPYYAKGQLVLKQVIMGHMPASKKKVQ